MTGQLLVSQPGGCAARLRGRTAIRAEIAERGLDRETDDLAVEGVLVTLGTAIGLVAVGGLAIGLATAPALAALGILPGAGVLAAVAASLAAVMGGVKLAAVGWGLAAQFVTRRTPRIAAASID